MQTLSHSTKLVLSGALLLPLTSVAAAAHHGSVDEIDDLIRRGRSHLDSAEPDKAIIDALRPAIEAGQVTLLPLDASPAPRAAQTRPDRRPSVPADNGQQQLEL